MTDKVRLGDIAKVISGYAFKSSEFTSSGVPVIKIANIRVGDVDLQDCQFVSQDYTEAIDEKYKVLAGDVLISLTGSQITQPNSVVGRVARQRRNAPLCLLNQRAGKVIIKNPNVCDKTFIYYALFRPETRKILASMGHGAASQANVSPSQVESLEIPFPSIKHQRIIASVLSAYDDLIENNTRRIQGLEEILRRIYEEWFVRLRFPGYENVKMVESELGLIPTGWKIQSLGEILLTLEAGSRPKGGIDPNEKGIPSIGAENINGLGNYDFSKEKYVSSDFYEQMRRGKVKSEDVMLYKDGAYIGRKALFRDGYPHEECAVNEHVFILRTNSVVTQSYLYFWLDLPNMTSKIRALNANAAQPGINQVGVKNLPILVPSKSVLNKFTEQSEPSLALLFNLAKKNLKLRATRDLLLPKLISGEIDVSNFPKPISD